MYLHKKLGRLTKEDFEMTRFQGFETKEVAEECVKKDGGVLCGKEDDDAYGDYSACVVLGGKKYTK